jgi:hypothetical protein
MHEAEKNESPARHCNGSAPTIQKIMDRHFDAAATVRADLIPGGVVDIGGTGFGAVNTVLTFQATGQNMAGAESARVGVSSSGVLNSIGSSVCQGGNAGGMEKNPAGSRTTKALP